MLLFSKFNLNLLINIAFVNFEYGKYFIDFDCLLFYY